MGTSFIGPGVIIPGWPIGPAATFSFRAALFYGIGSLPVGGGSGAPQQLKVTHLVIDIDCWDRRPNPLTLGAPTRRTRFVAYNGSSPVTDPRVVIQERVTTDAGGQYLATRYITRPDSMGAVGVFDDSKSLNANLTGPLQLYQSFKVSTTGAGGQFQSVQIYMGSTIGMRGTLGVYYTWNYPNGFFGDKDYNVFVEGVGKASLPECK